MAKLLKLRRGTDTQHSTFTGAEGEVTVNTTNDSLHVHDGTTAGGTELRGDVIQNGTSNVSVAASGDVTITRAGTVSATFGNGNININDNIALRLGTGADLRVFHDGNHSVISDSGTGQLQVRSDGFRVNNVANTANMITADEGGDVQLYHNGGLKLATTSTGIDVTGTVTCDGITSDGTITAQSAIGVINVKDTGNTGASAQTQINWQDSAGTNQAKIGLLSAINDDLYINAELGGINFASNGTTVAFFDDNGHFRPNANNTYDLGSSTSQWRNAYFDGTVNCDGLSVNGAPIFEGAAGVLTLKDNDGTGGSTTSFVEGKDSANSSVWYVGHGTSSDTALYVSNQVAGDINFRTGSGTKITLQNAGHLVPNSSNNYDLGTSSLRWRNIYTNDLNLSNEGGTNDVDGTWGSWTIQEGEDDLFLLNRRNGKKYKFNLSEVN